MASCRLLWMVQPHPLAIAHYKIRKAVFSFSKYKRA
nr:MAG TPA: hypothetical protein [Caudoviricetes sp.]